MAATFRLIIVDEAHHALPDNTYGQVLTALGAWQDSGPLVCGFTATPFRPNNTPLITTGQARGCFDEVVYTLPLPWMIEHGYLVPIVAHGIFVEGLDLDRIRTSHGDYSADALVRCDAHGRHAGASGQRLPGDHPGPSGPDLLSHRGDDQRR